MGPQLLDRRRKRLVRIADEQRCLVFRSIRVNGVAMTEAVRVVVANHGLLDSPMVDLQLYGKLRQPFTLPLVRTANLNLVRQKLKDPGSLRGF